MKNCKPGKIIFLFFLFFAFCISAAVNDAEKRILFINSTRNLTMHNYNILAECNRVLETGNIVSIYSYEDLEMMFPDTSTMEKVRTKTEPIVERIERGVYDVVVPIGQDAVDLLTVYGDRIPNDIAVIPCGVGMDTARLYDVHKNMTSVIGESGADECLKLAMHIFPDSEWVFYIGDESRKSVLQKEILRKIESQFPKVKFIYPDNAVTTLNELTGQIAMSGKKAVVILDSWSSRNWDPLQIETLKMRLGKCGAKVFAVSEFREWEYLNGGFHASAGEMGKALGNAILETVRRGNICAGGDRKLKAVGYVDCNALIKNGFNDIENIPGNVVKRGHDDIMRISHDSIMNKIAWGMVSVVVAFAFLIVLTFRQRRNMRYMKAVLSNLPGRILLSDSGGLFRMLHYNEYLQNFSIGRRNDELPVTITEDLMTKAGQVLENGESIVSNKEIEGRIFKIEQIFVPKSIFGFDSVLWQMTDITEYAMAVKHSRRSVQAKNNYFAVVGHELRTSLNAVIGFTELLQLKDISPEKQEEYQLGIYAAAKSLVGLIDETVDISKLEDNTLVSVPKPVNVNEIGEDVARMFSKFANDKGIYLRFEKSPDIPEVMIDGIHLRQILSIIVSNAVKFTEKGGAVIRIRHTMSEDGETVNLAVDVEDTGVGIAPENRKHILEPFSQGSNIEGALRKHKVIGLGLPLARALARYIGGNVTFKSELRKGSVFTVAFNCVPVVRKHSDAAASQSELRVKNRRKKVLLVDDSPRDLDMLLSMMHTCNAEILAASSAKDALDKLKEFDADIVFTEYYMADMPGDELAQKIHCSPKLFHVKVVAVTADVECGEKSGDVFDHVIYKPVTMEKLLSAMDNLL